jgi:hypothetical protein
MTAVAVVAAIAVVGAVVARVTWRRPADERHSIQSHQQTLDTLRAMADRRSVVQRDGTPAPPSDATTGSPTRMSRARPGPAHAGQGPPGPTRSGQAPSGPVRSGSVRAPTSPPSNGNGRHDLVFMDDAGPAAEPRPGAPARSPVLTLPGLPRSARGGHGRTTLPRGTAARLLPAVAAVCVLGLVAGLAVTLAPSHPRDTSASHRSGTRPKSKTGVTDPHTTVTAPPEVQPTTSAPGSASYAAPSTGYTVALRATGPCWVEATATSTGDVVWTGTLATGQSQSIPATGSLFVRLGAANDVGVTLNGEPVLFPTGFQSPFDMTFTST